MSAPLEFLPFYLFSSNIIINKHVIFAFSKRHHNLTLKTHLYLSTGSLHNLLQINYLNVKYSP